MGSGDLNAKKSWHPLRATNINATAKAEADAIAARKRNVARLEEIKEDIKREEIQKAIEAAGGKRRGYDPKLAWMYSGPTDGRGADSTESEAYLLGKRRIDKLLQDNEVKKLQKQTSQDSLAPVQSVLNPRDTAVKIREDPLLAMKKVEQQAYESLMNDPIKRRQLLASMGLDDPDAKPKQKEERKHKHRHRHHRHRDDDHDRDRERERDSYTRRRSDSRDRSRSRSPRRYDSDDEYSRRRRRRDSREYRRPQSPRRRDSDEDYSRRRRRSSPEDRRNDDHSNGRSARNGGGTREQDGEERARKLAAMQEAASDLDHDRKRRLAAIEEAERSARETEERARERATKFGGGDREFSNKLHRKAGEVRLADRVARSQQGPQQVED